MPALNSLHERYGNQAAFYVVYIQEAHPVDGWQMQSNAREHLFVSSTKNLQERTSVADACMLHLGIKLPALVDRPDDKVETAYTGWPDRLYVIDSNGRVAYKSAAGPFGFKPAEVEAMLRRILPAQPSVSSRALR